MGGDRAAMSRRGAMRAVMRADMRADVRAVTRAVMIALGALAIVCSGQFALAQKRQLGTVGPPPREHPQRETAAEGMPPLPLPAVPMRRSEPKAEPKPPTFIARLAYGQSQDYMPNPGALDNLLRHVRKQLDAWHGHTVLKMSELVAMQQQAKRNRIPLLYVTGYESFSWNDKQRAALREYILDGGTLLGVATLGSPAFTQSFKQEMRQVFPKRDLDVLQPDHPVYRGYYQYENVEYFTAGESARSKSESVPRMLGINIAARTAVVLSPYDMACGWDEFYAPAAPRRGDKSPTVTQAMMPDDAIRMGINLVAYVSAERSFAKAQAYTRKIEGTQRQQRAAVRLGLLRHHGDWNPDPNSLYQLIRLAATRTSVPVSYDLARVDPTIQDLADVPILIMTGMDEPRLNEKQTRVLRRHLQAGGFLFINNTSGYARFDRSARALIGRLMPERRLKRVPEDHALLNNLYEIDEVTRAGTEQAEKPHLEAVFTGDRAAIVYSPNDTLGMLKGIHDPYANAYSAESARQVALNVICYALRH